jgi:hypothetical protein
MECGNQSAVHKLSNVGDIEREFLTQKDTESIAY